MDSGQWTVVRRIPKQFRERGNGKWEKGQGSREEASGADKIENLKLKVEN